MFGGMMGFPGGDEDDDIVGAHMRNMNNMMNSMLSNPFGMMGGGMGMNMGMSMNPMQMAIPGMGAMGGFMPPMMQMPNMNAMMQNIQKNGNCHSYSSSSVMSMTNGPDGRPQVYQASSSTRSAPGGIKETKKSVCDTRTGVKKLAIGHSIGDKAHIIEREQNIRSGEQEERQDFINLDEDESETFNREWQQKARQAQLHSLEYPQQSSRHNRYHPEQLALPECTSTSSSNKPPLAIKSSSPPRNSISRKREHDSDDDDKNEYDDYQVENLSKSKKTTDSTYNQEESHDQNQSEPSKEKERDAYNDTRDKKKQKTG